MRRIRRIPRRTTVWPASDVPVGDTHASDLLRQRLEAILDERLCVLAYEPILATSIPHLFGVMASSRFGDSKLADARHVVAQAEAFGMAAEFELLAAEVALADISRLADHAFVSLRLSPATCSEPRFTRMLDHYSVPGRRVVVELTQTAGALPAAEAARLRALGVRFTVPMGRSQLEASAHIAGPHPEILVLSAGHIATVDSDPRNLSSIAALVARATAHGVLTIARPVTTAAQLRSLAGIALPAVAGPIVSRRSVDITRWNRILTEAHSRHDPATKNPRFQAWPGNDTSGVVTDRAVG